MGGTIEPRLIAPNSFSELSWESYSSLDLPPLQYFDGLQPYSRPLILAPLAPRGNAQQSGLAGALHHESYDGETAVNQYGFGPNVLSNEVKPQVLPRLARATTSQSLRQILADEADPTQTPPRKRQRKDEFVKLPQPEKKQKGSQQVVQPLVPPIIVGIDVPANQASTFRPIVDGGPFRDSHGRSSLNTAADATRPSQKEHIQPRSPPRQVQPIVETVSPPEPPHAKQPPVESTVRVVQARNKWTEEETKQLLLGVKKHGIGNWKRILEDKEFKFNNRKAVHIKDRFRTCFPDGCDGQVAETAPSGSGQPLGEMKEDAARPGTVYQLATVSFTTPSQATSKPPSERTPPKKGRSHRKDLSDLKEIGIVQPFVKSKRRQRRAFTAEEDKNILIGFQKYGQSNWTAIHRDPTLGLESRQPTDIRDRFRNRYPEKHKEITEDGSKEEVVKAPTALRTVVSIEELLDPDVSPSSSFQSQSQPQNQNQNPPQDSMQPLPPISSQTYPDILGTSGRLPTFTELLGPLPAMDVPEDPFLFPDWPFGNEEFWLPEIQTATLQQSAGTGRQNTGRNVYDISSICEAVESYEGHGMRG